MRLAFMFLLLLCGLSAAAQHNEKKCRSVVLSAEDGATLQGAIITTWPGKLISISDNTGSFEMPCNVKIDSISVSHLNFIPLYLSMKNNATLPTVFRLQPKVRQLDEVQVNTGYQALPKERVKIGRASCRE